MRYLLLALAIFIVFYSQSTAQDTLQIIDFPNGALDRQVLLEESNTDPQGPELQLNDQFYALPPNYATPWSQFDHMAFMAEIQNTSSHFANNAKLDLQIIDSEGNTFYESSREYLTIRPHATLSDHFLPGTLYVDPWNGHSVSGTYQGTYTLTHDNSPNETNTNNDSLSFTFEITDTLFAKAPETDRFYAPDSINSYLIGNVFYVPNGQRYFARYIGFEVGNPEEIAGYQNNNATLQLYEWKGDTNNDGLVNPEEYGNVPIAFFDYVFRGHESGMIWVPVEDLDGFSIRLKDNTYYIALVQVVANDEANDVYLSGLAPYNYEAVSHLTDSLARSGVLAAKQYGSVIAVGNPSGEAVTFTPTTFGDNLVSTIKLSIGLRPVSLTETGTVQHPSHFSISQKKSSSNYQISASPNPVQDFLHLQLNFLSPQDVTIELYNTSGQRLHLEKHQAIQNTFLQYPTHSLAAGQYFIRVHTAHEVKSLPIIIK